ncbi:head-tail connector protein [Thermoactinomyces sp. DSM 45892]|uniref:head-tail connector protein n=1 Tax=Thermoactinomyces sp. DSM 45892 TaxID=1882753 RepID=UPI00089B0F8F|nr:head-tail connector protein [Thermoactinomyces sp. DSM 45892]SDY84620.1 uncharacterized phage protein (possible DNA packaging) [Thermoactinomyces sp. DSM 45892]
MDIKDMKTFLKIDHDDEDAIIEGMILAGREFIRNAAGEVNESSELYKLCLKLLVTHWFDNRNIFINGWVNEVPFSLKAMIYQLQYCGDTDA